MRATRITAHILRPEHSGKCAACKKETTHYCENCQRNFCPECFDKYHHPRLETIPAKRKDSRSLAQGEVRVQLADGTAFLGRLIDFSPHGFRIALKAGGLTTGEQVRLRYRWGETVARVVWTGEIGGVVQAGLVLP